MMVVFEGGPDAATRTSMRNREPGGLHQGKAAILRLLSAMEAKVKADLALDRAVGRRTTTLHEVPALSRFSRFLSASVLRNGLAQLVQGPFVDSFKGP